MRVAVLMPVLDGRAWLVEAIESILNQTLQDLRLLILDGGSTDGSREIAQALAARDPRIALTVTPGTTPTQRINQALDAVDAPFAAMAHADDISFADRLEVQLAAMGGGDVAILGGATHYWLHEKRQWPLPDPYVGTQTYPAEHADLVCRLLFWWCFPIPALMLNLGRLRAAGVRFDEDLDVCSDYSFYWDARRAGRLANLARPLIAYRHHTAGHGARSRDRIEAEQRQIRRRIAEESGLWSLFPPEEAAAFLDFRVEADRPLGFGDMPATAAMLDRVEDWGAAQPAPLAEAAARMLAEYRDQVRALGGAATARPVSLDEWQRRQPR